MKRCAVVIASLLAISAAPAPAVQPEVAKVLTDFLQFSSSELSDLRAGRVVRHAVEARTPGEMAVVGAVRVHATVDKLIDHVRNIAEFKRSPAVLQITRFSDPPVASDLDGLTVTSEDFDASDCRVGDCDIRLPADVIRRMPRETDGNDGAAHEDIARWFKQVLFDHVAAYWSGQPGRILSYDHSGRRIHPVEEFDGLLKNAPMLGALVPELPLHLAQFPAHPMAGAEDFLYWSKEKFGWAPFITVTQVTIVRPSDRLSVIASKDIYSSRYIDASLSITIASVDANDPEAFYLVYANRSRSSALRGLFSGLRKSIAERRARTGLEETLRNVKARLEAP